MVMDTERAQRTGALEQGLQQMRRKEEKKKRAMKACLMLVDLIAK
jgi:hypothetical protein